MIKVKNESTVKKLPSKYKPIKKRGTPEGDKQRDEFKARWGVYPHELID